MTTATQSPRTDVYTRVTNHIVEELETGVRPWFRPWKGKHAAGSITRPLRHSGEPYRGINVLMLWLSAELRGFASPLWLTYRQAKELGGHVREGETGSPVVFASSLTRTDDAEGEAETSREVHYLKQYTVFNAEQVADLPAHFYALAEPSPHPVRPVERAEQFFAATGADIRHAGERAYYATGADFIQVPPLPAFRDAESHAATLAHELTHWTGHPARLDRDITRLRWGEDNYAMEELVAEIGSAFLCADLGITPDVRPDHAAYVASWLRVLKDDKRAVFTAAAVAQKAVDYLHGLQPNTASAPEVAA